MKQKRAAVLVGLWLSATAASAGPFLSISPTYTDINQKSVRNPVGVSGSFGLETAAIPLYLEAEAYYSGQFGPDSDKDFHVRGGIGYIGIAAPVSDYFRLLVKGGYHSLKLVEDGAGSTTDNDLAFGGGFEVMFDRQFGIRAEVENMVVDDLKDIQIYKAGFVWRPLNQIQSRFETNPAPAAYYPSPTPAASPAPAVVSALKPGDQARATPGSWLRATPQQDSAIVQSLTPSPLLKLENSIVNATGTWWFVSTDIERGWLRADELIKP